MATPSLLLLLTVLLLGLSSQQAVPTSLHPTDLSALLDIATNLRDLPGSHFFSTWDFNSDPCTSFEGVTCSSSSDDDDHLRVSVLYLGSGLADSPGLTGTLPTSLSSLTFLTDLVINPGRISGPLPATLPLPLLRLLSVTSNLISGPIPLLLSTLPALHTLDLSHNLLSGPLPPPPPSLKVLILAGNNLSGDLPATLSDTHLLHLDVRQNVLSGALPPLPTTLRYLGGGSNNLSGTLAAALAAPPPGLTFLDLSENAFTGRIPAAVFSLPALSAVLLQRNNLSGALAVEDGGGWAVVDLSHNALSGRLPAELAAAGSLFVNSNRLTGAVPAEYGRRLYAGEAMTTFYAQHNFLTEFPAPPGPLPESVALCLSYNCLVPPPGAAGGCPDNAGTLLPRPAEQCTSAAVGGGG